MYMYMYLHVYMCNHNNIIMKLIVLGFSVVQKSESHGIATFRSCTCIYIQYMYIMCIIPVQIM